VSKKPTGSKIHQIVSKNDHRYLFAVIHAITCDNKCSDICEGYCGNNPLINEWWPLKGRRIVESYAKNSTNNHHLKWRVYCHDVT